LEVYIIVGWKEGSSSARRGMDVSKEWVFAGYLREYDVEGEKEGEESRREAVEGGGFSCC
jgi:hypothetical protein